MPQEPNNLHLYTNILRFCEKRQLSIAELERAAGIGNGVIRKWDNAFPTLRTVSSVADTLGVTLDELLKG